MNRIPVNSAALAPAARPSVASASAANRSAA